MPDSRRRVPYRLLLLKFSVSPPTLSWMQAECLPVLTRAPISRCFLPSLPTPIGPRLLRRLETADAYSYPIYAMFLTAISELQCDERRSGIFRKRTRVRGVVNVVCTTKDYQYYRSTGTESVRTR